MLLELHTDFSGGRLGGLVFQSLEEFPTICCDPHRQRLWCSQIIVTVVILIIDFIDFNESQSWADFKPMYYTLKFTEGVHLMMLVSLFMGVSAF